MINIKEEDVQEIVRRKARRIDRASGALEFLKNEISELNVPDEEYKKWILQLVEEMEPYLKNDDREDNSYNRER